MRRRQTGLQELWREHCALRVPVKPEEPPQNVRPNLQSVWCTLLETDVPSATGHNRSMIALLRELRDQVGGPGRVKIDDLLASVSARGI
jgi:hypothetical protein